MSNDKSPAFRFYARDFLTSEKQQDMSLQEAGVYIRLMCHCWLNGSLPDDLSALARRAVATEAQMRKFWPAVSKCFELREDGRWYHGRLEGERERQQKFRERQSSNGKKGGRPTANVIQNKTHGFESTNPPESLLANADANATASGSSLERGVGKTAPPLDVWLRQLQDVEYPQHRVTRNVRTEQEFVTQMLGFPDGPEAAWNVLLANLDSNKLSHEWLVKRMIPRLEKYLHEGLWRNALPADAPAAEQLSARTMRMLG